MITPVLACGSMHFSGGTLTAIGIVAFAWFASAPLAIANALMLLEGGHPNRALNFTCLLAAAIGAGSLFAGILPVELSFLAIVGVPLLVIGQFLALRAERRKRRNRSSK